MGRFDCVLLRGEGGVAAADAGSALRSACCEQIRSPPPYSYLPRSGTAAASPRESSFPCTRSPAVEYRTATRRLRWKALKVVVVACSSHSRHRSSGCVVARVKVARVVSSSTCRNVRKCPFGLGSAREPDLMQGRAEYAGQRVLELGPGLVMFRCGINTVWIKIWSSCI